MKEYQEQIIKIIRNIKNVAYLKMLLGFVKELEKKEEENEEVYKFEIEKK